MAEENVSSGKQKKDKNKKDKKKKKSQKAESEEDEEAEERVAEKKDKTVEEDLASAERLPILLSEQKVLLENVLDALYKLFLYDTENFVSKARRTSSYICFFLLSTYFSFLMFPFYLFDVVLTSSFLRKFSTSFYNHL